MNTKFRFWVYVQFTVSKLRLVLHQFKKKQDMLLNCFIIL